MMNKSHLVACTGCARHVRASEAVCPFCRADLPRSLRDAAAPTPPMVRLGRAAILALGTGAATLAVACGGNVESADDGGSQMNVNNIAPPYGAVPPPDSGEENDAASEASFMGTAAYGGVSPEDAGVVDSAPPEDAPLTSPNDGGQTD